MDVKLRRKIMTKARIPSGQGHVCACGCDEAVRFTKGRWSRFRPGHDTRLVGRLLQLSRSGDVRIEDAVEFLDNEFSDRLASHLLRYWHRIHPERSGGTSTTCKVLVPCGKLLIDGKCPVHGGI